MQKAVRLFLCVCFLAVSTQAQAFYTLDFSSLGGNVYTDIDTVLMAGGSTVQQFTASGTPGDVQVGDVFQQTTVNPYVAESAKYFKNGDYHNMLGTDVIGLKVDDGVLNGVVTSLITAGVNPLGFEYKYVAGEVVSMWYDNGGGATEIAKVTLTDGGGLNLIPQADKIGFSTGTFNLLGSMQILVDNVFYYNGKDLFDELSPLVVAMSTLDGSINLGKAFDVDGASFKQTVKSSGDMTIYATPEPATMTLLGIGALGAAFLRRRSRRSN